MHIWGVLRVPDQTGILADLRQPFTCLAGIVPHLDCPVLIGWGCLVLKQLLANPAPKGREGWEGLQDEPNRLTLPLDPGELEYLVNQDATLQQGLAWPKGRLLEPTRPILYAGSRCVVSHRGGGKAVGCTCALSEMGVTLSPLPAPDRTPGSRPHICPHNTALLLAGCMSPGAAVLHFLPRVPNSAAP